MIMSDGHCYLEGKRDIGLVLGPSRSLTIDGTFLS